jgi:hypothetical protein
MMSRAITRIQNAPFPEHSLGIALPKVLSRVRAFFTENRVVPWTGLCGPMCATATSVVASRFM